MSGEASSSSAPLVAPSGMDPAKYEALKGYRAVCTTLLCLTTADRSRNCRK